MKKRKYFHTFNALRFFFFLLVFLLHSSTPDGHWANFILNKGGVSFFFVLSGFLITYILLFEKTETGGVNLKRFFKKRGLRIYPLFYLLIIFAYLSPFLLKFSGLPSSDEGYKPNILTSIFFLENYKMMMTNSFPNGAPLRVMWSLCVNEHFYIIWSIILSYVSIKKIPYFIATAILMSTLVRLLYTMYNIPHLDILSNFDYFALGAIPAYLLITKPTFTEYIEKVPITVKYLFAIIVVILPKSLYAPLSPLISGILFTVLLSFTLCSSKSLTIKENLWVSKLGKYSYGMYLYHTICILLVLQLFKLFSFEIHWLIPVFVSLALTILVSILSYHLFEKRILKLKKSNQK